MSNMKLFLLALPLTIAGCGPAPGTRAHDDSVAGHRRQSEAHQADADKLAFPNSKTYYQSVRQDHERLAAAHLRAAQQLEAEYAAACQDRAPDAAKQWPDVASVELVPGGVVLHFTPAVGSEDEVLANIECHRAALAVDGFDRFPDDPLALPTLDVVVHAEQGGTAVMLGVDDDAQVAELRRRAEVVAAEK